MLARLLENQPLDAWMTHELMEKAIEWVEADKPFDIEWTSDLSKQTRDQRTSTTADKSHLDLQNTAVDKFFNFQNINAQGQVGMRHINRPDGMFLLSLETTSSGPQNMVLFYEGDVHKKDANKSLTQGCKNSQKMYQAIAQAQSRNINMAGCAIFAAMDDAPTDQLLPFVEDMLKAHIFVCIAIADWNAHIYVKNDKNRKTTMIGNFFKNSLHVGIEYDFVFGINIGLGNASPGFELTDYNHRIRTMLDGMNYNAPVDIEIADNMKFVASHHIKSTKIGMVQIVICAIPRQTRNILQRARDSPMFIYPMHIDAVVPFIDKKAVSPSNPFAFLTITAGGQPLLQQPFHFEQNMMDKTSVEVNPGGQALANGSKLTETNGFFFLALPLAYYTIQQFECVNSELNYEWSPVRHGVRGMINTLKKNKQNLTGVTNVTMFTKNKSSLFQVICASVDCDDVEPLAADFELFLDKCCRWRETNANAAKGSSPKVIFRTLGIFSLQNAIDFACEMKANPNKTYSSLLASYPAGTQMVIQQCMKKLSSNEAYAWVQNPDVKKQDTKETDEQDSDDDNDGNSLADRYLKFEKSIVTSLFHSLWKVEVIPAADVAANTPATPQRPDAMAVKLLIEYQKSVNRWKIKTLNIAEQPQGIKASKDLESRLIREIGKKNIYYGVEREISVEVAARLFDPKLSYDITKENFDFQCTAMCPDTLKFPSSVEEILDHIAIGKTYETTWAATKIQFTLKTRSVKESLVNTMDDARKNLFESLRKLLLGETNPNDTPAWKLLKEIEDEKAAAAAAAVEDDSDISQLTDVLSVVTLNPKNGPPPPPP